MPDPNGGKWEKVRLYVDSGATETVIGESILGFVELREGLAFIRGVKYEVANGIRIPNLGERSFVGTSEEGFKRHPATISRVVFPQPLGPLITMNSPAVSVRFTSFRALISSIFV